MPREARSSSLSASLLEVLMFIPYLADILALPYNLGSRGNLHSKIVRVEYEICTLRPSKSCIYMFVEIYHMEHGDHKPSMNNAVVPHGSLCIHSCVELGIESVEYR
ncbi:hypothetical protein HAX54_001190 [Datura stramonium]|uniref:Uncharacterized protein n=1 Tax=Datura stramonium TaxID=4076 RepID=A0ABS8T2X0_DATST|nr:hypothetical protein [Datura stramonium]